MRTPTKIGLALGAATVTLVLGCAGGGTATPNSQPNQPDQPAPTYTTVPPASQPLPTSPAPGTFDEGQYAPGELTPGEYRTTAPASGGCYISRHKGAADAPIDKNNYVAAGSPGLFVIPTGNYYIESSGDCVWTLSPKKK